MNLKGEPAHVGRHCGSNEYEVTKEGVAFYADALDDHDPLYGEAAPPLLHHSECYNFVGEWYLKNLFGNLHGRQDWWLFAPIPLEGRVRTRSTIIDRYQRRGRDWVVNETDLVDASDGRLLVRGHTHQSFLPPRDTQRGDGFVVDEKTAKRKSPPPVFPTAEGPDLAPVQKTVDQRCCLNVTVQGSAECGVARPNTLEQLHASLSLSQLSSLGCVQLLRRENGTRRKLPAGQCLVVGQQECFRGTPLTFFFTGHHGDAPDADGAGR